MFIHRVRVENFRAIRSLEATFGPSFNALIGPGDSGKTTILDALSYLFHPHWSLNLTDNDFFGGVPDCEILIRALVVDPPVELTADRAFFSHIRGIDLDTGNEVDEPVDHVPALLCELRIGPDFEPSWKVVCDRHEDGLSLSAANRRKFGVRRITSSDAHLRWNSVSALQHLTDSTEAQETETILRAVSRQARLTAKDHLKNLDTSVEHVSEQARLLRAIASGSSLTAELDADVAAMTRGSVALHQSGLPVARSGLGTRRLVSVGVQTVAAAGANVLLIDELESGLEPFRIRHLLRLLGSGDESKRQIVTTTHSPVVLRELRFDQLRVLRNNDGILRLLKPTEASQGTLRTHAEAFLAPRVLVCEGATEVGFSRGLSDLSERNDPKVLSQVASASSGGDTKLVGCANEFKRLEYAVAIFCDADNDKLDLTGVREGVEIIRCDDGLSIEQQTIPHLNRAGVVQLMTVARGRESEDRLVGHLCSAEMAHPDAVAIGSTGLMSDGSAPPPADTSVIANAAKLGGWFKSIDGGELLAQLSASPELSDDRTVLDPFLDKIIQWCVHGA